MKGRKPVPTNILAARGSPTAKERAGEPTPPLEAPEPPDELSDAARAEWTRIVPLLERLRLLARLDRAPLVIYCAAFARWQEAERHLAAQGVIVKSPNGYPIQNPYLAVSNTAVAQMLKVLAELGLSPASRTRLRGSASAAEPHEDDEKVDPVPFLRIAK
jgi:P27 family predicted phage terminase small subunit